MSTSAEQRLRPTLSRRHALALGVAGLTFGHGARAADYPKSWTFGDVTVTKIVEMSAPYPADKAFPGAPMEAFDEVASWMQPHFYDPISKGVIFSYHAYVVRTPRIVVMMDGGFGEARPAMRPGAQMESFSDNLRAAGIRPEQVTHVINSHFHSDHTGYNIRRDGEKRLPMYPKARYLFDRKEVDYFTAEAARGAPMGASFVTNVKPVIDAGVADIIDGAHEIDHGLRIIAMPGHTPGHHGLAIESKGKRAILSGDVLHSPIEIVHPEWTVTFDYDKDAGRAGRKHLLDQYTDADVTVLAAHFGGPTAGRIVSEKGGRRRFKTLIA